jgi:hypothetical protein
MSEGAVAATPFDYNGLALITFVVTTRRLLIRHGISSLLTARRR